MSRKSFPCDGSPFSIKSGRCTGRGTIFVRNELSGAYHVLCGAHFRALGILCRRVTQAEYIVWTVTAA